MMSKEPTGRICEFGNRASSTQDSKRTKAIHIMSQSYRVHEDDFQTVSTGWSAALRSGELFFNRVSSEKIGWVLEDDDRESFADKEFRRRDLQMVSTFGKGETKTCQISKPKHLWISLFSCCPQGRIFNRYSLGKLSSVLVLTRIKTHSTDSLSLFIHVVPTANSSFGRV